MNIKIIKVNPQIDLSVRGLCVKPYPGHIRGCPNFNHKDGCPPRAPLFSDIYDLSESVYAIVNIFDFKEHVDKMKQLHPNWSKRQLDCCLYWQPKARKQLILGIKLFIKKNPRYHVTTCPEAMGIEVTKTLELVGTQLEWPPLNVTYQVALAGIERKCRVCGCTWANGCRNGCWWVENTLCSNCI